MAIDVIANENGRSDFEIPVSWRVWSKIRVQANSLEEAYKWAVEHLDDIPIDMDSAEYADDSYQLDVESAEGAEMYQGTKMFCKSFSCLTEQQLKDFGDTLLHDSGEELAKATFSYCKDHELTIKLKVCGDVRIVYDGCAYKNAEQYPESLVDLIKAGKHISGSCENLFIDDSNWLEYVYEGKEDITICERDITKMAPEDILDDMTKIAENYFNPVTH